MSKFTKFSDIIDLRDVIARFEELEAELENLRELIVDAEDGGNAKAIDEAKSRLALGKRVTKAVNLICFVRCFQIARVWEAMRNGAVIGIP